MKPILLDTNLLVLLVLGSVDERWIGRHKRSKNFVAADWHLLVKTIGGADLLTTPHILAETSNHLRSGGMKNPANVELMAALVNFIGIAAEKDVTARSVAGNALFLRLGLTDTAIMSVAQSNVHLLTADLDLYLAALAKGQETTNFNHLREQ